LANNAKIITFSSSLGKFVLYKNPDLVKRIDNSKKREELIPLANEYRNALEKDTWEKDGWPTSLFGGGPAIYDVSKTFITIWTRILSQDEDIVKRNI